MLVSGSLVVAQEAAEREIEDVMVLPPFRVESAPLEDFGFRIGGQFVIPGTSYLMVAEVLPNTAAAKAGLRPGEVITKMDGKSVSVLSTLLKPKKLQERKWAELDAGKKSVTYSLEVHAPGSAVSRTVAMVIPSPAPHWGSKMWSVPEGRIPVAVKEAGPLAALARDVLNNGIWSVFQRTSFLGTASIFEAPILGYEWRIVQPSDSHRIWVTQQRGKTEIIFEHRSKAADSGLFLTSPSGAMEKASCWPPKKNKKSKGISTEEVRAQFTAEIDFWLTKVGRVTGRWPFEVLGNTGVAVSTGASSDESAEVNATLAESFLKLPGATAAQKALFFDALGKIGLDANCWAFTETVRNFDDDHVTTVRFDPSMPPDESAALLKVDGKAPKSAYLQQWRSEGHVAHVGLGELPPLSSIVDLNDVRIYSDETAAVVFELPVKASNPEFPADKFQARFRVNKTQRGFEDFSVKLREAMRVAGVAKVTDAGFEARFQTLDPARAPQPVMLKMGGGLRVLFVKISRAFEVTRTDFKRVVPFEAQEKPVP